RGDVPLGALPGHQQRRHVPVDGVGGQHGDLVAARIRGPGGHRGSGTAGGGELAPSPPYRTCPREISICLHLHTYVTELALAAEPQQAPRVACDIRGRERLVNKPASVPEQFDAVVVGAGFSGLYMLYRLRQL